jgi:hypothetical protein
MSIRDTDKIRRIWKQCITSKIERDLFQSDRLSRQTELGDYGYFSSTPYIQMYSLRTQWLEFPVFVNEMTTAAAKMLDNWDAIHSLHWVCEFHASESPKIWLASTMFWERKVWFSDYQHDSNKATSSLKCATMLPENSQVKIQNQSVIWKDAFAYHMLLNTTFSWKCS